MTGPSTMTKLVLSLKDDACLDCCTSPMCMSFHFFSKFSFLGAHKTTNYRNFHTSCHVWLYPPSCLPRPFWACAVALCSWGHGKACCCSYQCVEEAPQGCRWSFMFERSHVSQHAPPPQPLLTPTLCMKLLSNQERFQNCDKLWVKDRGASLPDNDLFLESVRQMWACF